MTPVPEVSRPENAEQLAEQSALACYLRAVVAIGTCMAEVCPPVGTMYRDRLLKLPRRLAFDATPRALQQSREAVETDLLEYSGVARAWIQGVAQQPARVVDHLRKTEENLSAAADLQAAFLEDMAEHMEAAAQVDDEAELRRSFARYAAGLRAYSRRANKEKLATLEEFREKRKEIESWDFEATTSIFNDPDSGLLNRAAAERRIQTEVGKQKAFCVIVVGWTEEGDAEEGASGQVAKELGERLASTIRPYDLIFRWSQTQLVTIFEAPEADIASRAKQIAGWLGDPLFPVEIAGEASSVKIRTSVSVLEWRDGETAAGLTERIEAQARQAVAA